MSQQFIQGDEMPSHQDMINAARTVPSRRTSRERELVKQGQGNQEIRNADHDAHKEERVYGPNGKP